MDQLVELEEHTRQDPYDDPYEASLILWQDEADEWWATDVFTEGDTERSVPNVFRLTAPADSKNQLTLHTHPPLDPDLSHTDLLQLVPYTDDRFNAVGPHYALAVLSLNAPHHNLRTAERTEIGRQINDIETVRAHIERVESLHDEYALTPEFARKRILEYYGECVSLSNINVEIPVHEKQHET
jgi:proteasome lid subunit RPN8/RPN11